MTDRTDSARAIIADFGSAIQLRSVDETTSWRIGTPGYIAPEIYRREPYGLSVDVWSFGCMLHVLLSGQYALWEDNA
jgi:serine/threonine protein kinase